MQEVLLTAAALARRVIAVLLFIVVIGAVAGNADSLPTYAYSTHASLLHSYVNVNRPVLAFYYAWYNRSDWCLCRMPDLPSTQYDSSDDHIIDQQIHWAADAGITGFINSWWGPGDKTDTNFAKLLNHAASLPDHYFASTLYFESEAPTLQGEGNIVNGLRYIISHYSNDSHFLHWHGKPMLFFWKPLGQGRTLAEWAWIRKQVDPRNHMIWSAEGVDASLLNVFDGIHLFSAGYWGLLHGNMAAVDQGFRNKVNAYNSAFGTQKIWAAGVMPGYDDTHLAGRPNTFKVPRNNGTTYHISWDAAIASNPEMITITSFNEWFEGSMIEPSVTYHTTYLDITRTYARYWHR